ncbi:MAG: hypothetical protein ACYC5H_01275 [Methylovirgula sp.]
MTANYHSKICAIAHNAMEQLFAAGLLDAERMFEFDLLCRTDVRRDAHFAAIRREAAASGPQSQPTPTVAQRPPAAATKPATALPLRAAISRMSSAAAAMRSANLAKRDQ